MVKRLCCSVSRGFWALVYRLYPHTRDFLLWTGVLKHVVRQPYRLGFLHSNQTVEGFRAHLHRHGYHENPMAWIDPEEVLNMRKLINIHYQYHVRVFPDGEVKGHFECTPERHPIAHLNEIAMLPAREYFKTLLKDWLTNQSSVQRSLACVPERAETLMPKYHLPQVQVFQTEEMHEDQ